MVSSEALPHDLTSLIGRESEGHEVRALLGRARLVCLNGPGGVGKTRTALHVARQVQRGFPDGVRFVELAALKDPSLLEPVVAAALDQDDFSGTGLVERLSGFRGLIVLDNCEHLVDACAALVHDLLVGAPGLTVLATSREVLGLGGEHVVRVAPLTVPDPNSPLEEVAAADAVRLFVDRARHIDPHFELTAENAEAVARICGSVDGLPLAIELAAARLQTLSAQQIAARIAEPHRMLTRAPRDAPRRHASLDETLTWSYDLCSGPEQRLWAELSVFAGAVSSETIAQVGGEDDAEDVIDALVRKSIVVRESGDVVRFRLLDTVRSYGWRLLSAVDRADLEDRHAQYYERLVAECVRRWFSPEQLTVAARIRRDLPEVRAALQHMLDIGHPERALAMAAQMRLLWTFLGRLREGETWLARTLAAAHPEAEQRAEGLWVHGWIQLLLGRTAAARASFELSRRTAMSLGQGHAEDWARALLAAAEAFSGRLDVAIEAGTAAVASRQASGDRESTAFFLLLAAEWAWAAGDFDVALGYSRQMARISAAADESWCGSYSRWIEGLALDGRGEHEAANQTLCEALRQKLELDDVLGLLLIVEAIGWNLAAAGRWQEAARIQAAMETRWQRTCSPLMGFDALLRHRRLWSTRIRNELGAEGYALAAAGAEALDVAAAARFALDTCSEDRQAVVVPRTSPLSAAPVDLTPRESEVADLLAAGLSNRQIAARLVISVRTAEAHVNRVLGKLGLTRRAQVAATLRA